MSSGDVDRAAAGPRPGSKPKVIIVTGPTAVGKTKIGLELAKRLGGEVISADSVQVYTGLDTGSDKVRGLAAGLGRCAASGRAPAAAAARDATRRRLTGASRRALRRPPPDPLFAPATQLPEAQRQGVRHHLIDVLPPSAEFSAGDFYERGRRAAEDILQASAAAARSRPDTRVPTAAAAQPGARAHALATLTSPPHTRMHRSGARCRSSSAAPAFTCACV